MHIRCRQTPTRIIHIMNEFLATVSFVKFHVIELYSIFFNNVIIEYFTMLIRLLFLLLINKEQH